MSTQTYDMGDDVTESVEFKAEDILTDPTTVRFIYRPPNGEEVALLYGTDNEILRLAEGQYSIALVPTLPGVWNFRWEGEGAVIAAFEGAFNIRESQIDDTADKFASVELLSAYLMEDIDPEDLMANIALASATEAIRQYCDQFLSLVVDDDTIIDGSGSDTVLLPEFPVIDVDTVVDLNTDVEMEAPADYVFEAAAGMLVRRNGVWPIERLSISVKYTHGYSRIPPDIQMVCVAIAARAVAQDGAEHEGTGTFNETYAGQPGTITKDERRILDRYRARRR